MNKRKQPGDRQYNLQTQLVQQCHLWQRQGANLKRADSEVKRLEWLSTCKFLQRLPHVCTLSAGGKKIWEADGYQKGAGELCQGTAWWQQQECPPLLPRVFASASGTCTPFWYYTAKAWSASAPGPNYMPYRVYKNCPAVLKLLWRLLRAAWKTHSFPSAWCRAKIPGTSPSLEASPYLLYKGRSSLQWGQGTWPANSCPTTTLTLAVKRHEYQGLLAVLNTPPWFGNKSR